MGAQAPGKFAAVSIKPFQRGARPLVRGQAFVSDGAGLHAFNRSISELICYAYAIENFQLIGSPAWALPGRNNTYNLDANTSAPATNDQLRAMLRAAWADRLGLQLARQEKPTPVFALVVAAGGAKLRKLGVGEELQFVSNQPGTLTIQFATTQDFVQFYNFAGIARILGRPFVDDTGLTGRYDVQLPFPSTPIVGGTSINPHA